MLGLILYGTTAHSAIERPNLVLIMADDMGYECLASNGAANYSTPVLDRLASGGVRFDRCYSTPLCTPSRVQIMTGRYNHWNYDEFGHLAEGERTFGHLLQEAGYATCIAGKWQLNGLYHPERFPEWKDSKRPLRAGFDESCLWQVTQPKSRGERYADPLIEVNGQVLPQQKGKYGPDLFADFIIDFIQRHREQPFFVYYPMVLVHDPFVPTPDSPAWSQPENRYQKNDRYFADMVTYADKVIGRILKSLEKWKLTENTLVIFTGDNGTHRSIRTRMKDGSIVQGGKGGTLDNGTHVPLIASWPGTAQPGACTDLVDFTDMLPTLGEAAGILPEGRFPKGDGRSFLPRILGQPGSPRTWVYCHYTPRWGKFTHTRFVMDHQFKLYQDGRLLDPSVDPMEQSPILDSPSRKSLQSVLDAMPPWVPDRHDRP